MTSLIGGSLAVQSQALALPAGLACQRGCSGRAAAGDAGMGHKCDCQNRKGHEGPAEETYINDHEQSVCQAFKAQACQYKLLQVLHQHTSIPD